MNWTKNHRIIVIKLVSLMSDKFGSIMQSFPSNIYIRTAKSAYGKRAALYLYRKTN